MFTQVPWLQGESAQASTAANQKYRRKYVLYCFCQELTCRFFFISCLIQVLVIREAISLQKVLSSSYMVHMHVSLFIFLHYYFLYLVVIVNCISDYFLVQIIKCLIFDWNSC